MPTTLLKNPVNVTVASTSVSLAVSGTAAAATSGGGVQPSNTLTVEGTAGQATTGTGQTAGAGANVLITAGTGGAAPSGSTTGAGGIVTINPGPPGAGGGTAAAYGNVVLATAGGNVGVGTTSPASKLEVAGQVKITGGAPGNGKILTSDAAGLASWSNPTFSSQWATSGSNISYSDGRVGIGTASPGTLLHAQSSGTTTAVARIESTTTHGDPELQLKNGTVTWKIGNLGSNGETLEFVQSGTGTALAMKPTSLQLNVQNGSAATPTITPFSDTDTGLYFGGSNDVYIATGGTARVKVDGSGNVGIATTTPSSALHVGGGVQVGTPTGGDKGSGSINVSGDIYVNGEPVLQRLEAAYKTIVELTQRVERLEAAAGSPGKGKK